MMERGTRFFFRSLLQGEEGPVRDRGAAASERGGAGDVRPMGGLGSGGAPARPTGRQAAREARRRHRNAPPGQKELTSSIAVHQIDVFFRIFFTFSQRKRVPFDGSLFSSSVASSPLAFLKRNRFKSYPIDPICSLHRD